MSESILLTVKAAMAFSGLSRSTLYRWLADGTLAGKKIGRSTVIARESLIQAIGALPDYRGKCLQGGNGAAT